jgi:transaldolase
VVNTMPEATLRAVADHGEVPADSVRARYDDAQEVLHRLRALGIDFGDMVQTREDDGMAKFDASWDQLGEQLAAILRRKPTRQQAS